MACPQNTSKTGYLLKGNTMNQRTRISVFVAAALISGCSNWPDYKRPVVEAPASYKESFPGWKTAEPKDHLPNGAWWTLYGDAQLNDLQSKAIKTNQNIQLAEAHYRQAQAVSASAHSSLYPAISGNAAASRSQRSSNASSSNGTRQIGSIPAINNFDLGLSASWEIDFWGRIKHSVESGDASQAASAADLAAAILSVQASLAQNYFQLRVLDSQQNLLNDTVVAYERSLKLTQNRYVVGLATRTEIAQAETQLRSTRAQAVDNSLQRAQLEHAIAALIGQSPAQFSLPASPFSDTTSFKLPTLPASLPSELLEHRPDIAAAERRIAAANANIGVAKAAFFPTVSLSANAGFQSTTLGNLVSLPSRVWSLGPILAQTLFDGGLRQSQTDAAIAAYDASVATYKETILTSFQEVEDNLVALNLLEQEALEQDAAVRFSHQSVQQTLNRYKAGTVDYLSVVTVQTTALSNERTSLSLLGRRLVASVGLIKSLGGAEAFKQQSK